MISASSINEQRNSLQKPTNVATKIPSTEPSDIFAAAAVAAQSNSQQRQAAVAALEVNKRPPMFSNAALQAELAQGQALLKPVKVQLATEQKPDVHAFLRGHLERMRVDIADEDNTMDTSQWGNN
eukprot:CAMPEP_0196578184 /NCGR_PEP_ID=MMETSP1081-20130531/7139_1 /TAXON_ID=36882 /ORGANISM="Pyramimonas amylifera, Strain CCMP720" /LENGTH=124 /DNA_ID=CAMNT_0041897321 /DNA_START=117 /DNA_END=491 /DNA_ORIENTATION=+